MSARCACGPPRGLADHRGAGRLDDPDQGVQVDLALAQVLVAVAARAGPVLGVVGVDQVDPATDRLDPVDDAVQLLAAGMGVAGVEAEAQPGVADQVPQPGQGVEAAGHGVVPAGGVLEQHRHLGLELVERLSPADEALVLVAAVGDVAAVDDHPGRTQRGRALAGLGQQLARGDPDAVVGGGQVDPVGGVDVHDHVGGGQLGRVRAGRWHLPALGVAEEELHAVGAAGRPLAEGVLTPEMDPDLHLQDFSTLAREADGPAGGCPCIAGSWRSGRERVRGGGRARAGTVPSAGPPSSPTWCRLSRRNVPFTLWPCHA